jgi:P-type Ca2+ transporter type 2C
MRASRDRSSKPEMCECLTEAPWSLPVKQVIDELQVDPAEGLTNEQVRRRRQRCGRNYIRRSERVSSWHVLINQFRSLMVALLTVAAGISFAVGELVEGAAIVAVVMVSAAIGFFTELRGIRSMEALERLAKVSFRARRNGTVTDTDARDLVPGDIVLVDAGDVVTADLRLIESNNLQADESALTGESVPVNKQAEPTPENASLAERASMLYKGTSVSRGSGEGIVTSTGMNTELGLISSLTEAAEEAVTPLERRLNQLSQKLIVITLIIAAMVITAGVLAHRDLFLMLETGIALAVATIPEGLPIVATTALARGMLRMARNNALVNRLSAVATLGGTSVIAVDKTGTLTEGRMAVRRLELAAHSVEFTGDALSSKGTLEENGEQVEPAAIFGLTEAMKVAVLCNNASIESGPKGDLKGTGDPLELSLLVAAAKAGVSEDDVRGQFPELREEAFDPESKMMATLHRVDEGVYVAVKGSPETVVEVSESVLGPDGTEELSPQDREQWLRRNEEMAGAGLRVLALAHREMASEDGDVYRGLTLLGLVGMMDPPRVEAKQAVADCQSAGIRFIMATGDQALTAMSIAKSVGLVSKDDSAEDRLLSGSDLKDPAVMTEQERHRAVNAVIFARVTPKQKLDLIALHQAEGEVVAMTGDGINDAPALKKADIGVAMGQRGTQVAREAADMVLQDDQLASIVMAVKQGRVIFTNIRKFVLYLLSCNIGEVLVVAIGAVANTPLPILPLQILFLNMVTDVFPALALGAGEGDKHIMKEPPRDASEPVIASRHWIDIAVYGAMMAFTTLASLGVSLYWLRLPERQAVTVSFLTLATAQLWHVFNMREPHEHLFVNGITRNRWMWAALLLCIVLLVLAVELPILAEVLKITYPGALGLLVVLVASVLPLVFGQVYICIKNLITRHNK